MRNSKSNKAILSLLILIILGAVIFINARKESTDKPEVKKTVSSQDVLTPTIAISATPTPKELEKEAEKPQTIEAKVDENQVDSQSTTEAVESKEYNGIRYKVIEVDGGDISGYREANVAVNIGYGDREYWAFTNEYGQLIYVIAEKIILQDDSSEPVNSDGRYYDDEAKVPGTESEVLDEGHIIADSLGGVSNAYNITPQNSTLNRHGDQAYMEKVIRNAGGCEYFVATITYPDTETQIPSHYHYEYILNGEQIVDDFDNINPDEVNSKIEQEPNENKEDVIQSTLDEKAELKRIDKNGNGKVTIAEAKSAGYAMPIYSDHWLYKYMDDRDGDGMVGE